MFVTRNDGESNLALENHHSEQHLTSLGLLFDDTFFLKHWTHNAVYFPGFNNRLIDIFGWKEFNLLLQQLHKILVPPMVGMVREGKPIQPELYTDLVADRKKPPFRQISSSKIIELCASGATLIVNGVERFSAPFATLH